GRGAVDRLVRGSAVDTVVGPLAPAGRRPRVNAAAPPGGAEPVEAVRVASGHQGLGSPVPPLLTEVSPGAGPPVVPHQGRGVEADLPAGVEHLPAQVDV